MKRNYNYVLTQEHLKIQKTKILLGALLLMTRKKTEALKSFYKLTRPGHIYEIESSLLLFEFLENLLNIHINVKCKGGMLHIFLEATEEIFKQLNDVLFKPMLSGRYNFQIEKELLAVEQEKVENLLRQPKEE